ncbi:unnamed protein product [Peronospora destructor]|uniref:Uncharacterized protein n=1 Tax=Peronospora destructor TaxID=86335 RepID=A0AAV0TJU5_9STRA|nr:unnamed protein product [Peronospora destructor]
MSPSPFNSVPAALASAIDASMTSARIDKRGVVEPEHCLTTEDQSAYKRKARKAFAIICLAIEGSQFLLMQSLLDAFEAWTKLVMHFEKKNLANKAFLRRRLFATVMKDGDDVLEHINKLRTPVEKLDVVGAPVSSEDLVITLLSNSLNDSFPVPHDGVGVAFGRTHLGARHKSSFARRLETEGKTAQCVSGRSIRLYHSGVSSSDQAFYTNGKRNNNHSAQPKGA